MSAPWNYHWAIENLGAHLVDGRDIPEIAAMGWQGNHAVSSGIGRKIALNPNSRHSPEVLVAHELAHIMLEHSAQRARGKSHAECEVEASLVTESVMMALGRQDDLEVATKYTERFLKNAAAETGEPMFAKKGYADLLHTLVHLIVEAGLEEPAKSPIH